MMPIPRLRRAPPPRLRVLAALLAATLAPLPALANARLDGIAMSLEELAEVRILATPKFAEDAEHSPSAVTIVTRADIRTFGWRTLADVLRSLQGFTVTDDHTYSYAGVRGVSAPGDYRQRFQVLIDGMSVNENVYASVPVDSAFPLDLDLVERIEVIRGPSASVYGGDSMFGVVNLVTRSGDSLNGNEAALSLGSGLDRRARLTRGGETDGGIGYLVSASGFNAQGQGMDFPEMSAAGLDPRATRLRGETGGRMFAQLRSSDWRATFTHSERDRIVPTGSYATDFNDPAHREKDVFTLAELGAVQALDGDTTVHERVYFGRYRYRAVFPYTYTPDYVLNRDDVVGEWWGMEGRVVSRALAGQRWTVGAELRENLRQDQKNADAGYGCYGLSASPCLDSREHSRLFNLYAQNEINVGPATLLTLGMRFDQRFGANRHWSPRVGLVHETANAGIFKLLYASAFRDPTVFERFYTTPTYIYGNPVLRSERMQSIEAAWEKRIGNGRLTASVYLFRLKDLIAPDVGTGVVQNSGPLTGQGLELEYEQRWLDRYRLRTGYTFQQPRGDGGRPENAARHMLKANLGAELGGGFIAGLEGQYVSTRLTGDSGRRVPDYAIANLNLRYLPAGPAWELALGLYNLFDIRFSEPAAGDTTVAGARWTMPQLGRTAMLTARLGF
ncbi:MAG: TonB-dependent receptor [Zoogloea sp.]|nr:TonB-dependent receptor [Zoogloea sp.]